MKNYFKLLNKLYFLPKYLFFRHTYNIAIRDLYGMVMKGLIEIPLRDSQDMDPGAQLANVKKVIKNSKILYIWDLYKVILCHKIWIKKKATFSISTFI